MAVQKAASPQDKLRAYVITRMRLLFQLSIYHNVERELLRANNHFFEDSVLRCVEKPPHFDPDLSISFLIVLRRSTFRKIQEV